MYESENGIMDPKTSDLTDREEVAIEKALKLMKLAESWMQVSYWYSNFPMENARILVERAENILHEHGILPNKNDAKEKRW